MVWVDRWLGNEKKKESAGGAEVWLAITHHACSLCLPPGPRTQLGIFSRFTVQPLLQLSSPPHVTRPTHDVLSQASEARQILLAQVYASGSEQPPPIR